MMSRQYYVYFMTNAHDTTLYTGVTSDLQKRVYQHKAKAHHAAFTSRYKCSKLVYFEVFGDVELAIKREKSLKKWARAWKNELVNKDNPQWIDLSEDWGL